MLFTQPLKYNTFKQSGDFFENFFLNGFDKVLNRFIKLPNMYFDSRKKINFPDKVFFAYSYFAVSNILHTSIALGQKLLHLSHLRHKSRYLFMFLKLRQA